MWQQSICWTFLLLSGFCWSMGRRHLKRGLLVLGVSFIVSAVTILVMPESQILFGVLCLIGSAMLLMIPLDKVLCKVNPYVGAILAFFLFLVTKNVPEGTLGLAGRSVMKLPQRWYANLFTAYLGLPAKDFYSTDYFPIIPWVFLFITGYFLYHIFRKRNWLRLFEKQGIASLSFMGRHSLILYVAHQPVIYGVLYLWFNILKNML